MNRIPFRKETPKRSCEDKFSSYRKYKGALIKDFNRRCGYTDCPDRWFGGENTFHIDHFKPRKKYPDLETEYSNLVYACSYINILKSDDDSTHYLDPCEEDYNYHFYRDKSGKICPNPSSEKAKYMHTKLKLGLMRYQAIWLLEEIFTTLENVNCAIDNLSGENHLTRDLNLIQTRLLKEFIRYFNYLTNNKS